MALCRGGAVGEVEACTGVEAEGAGVDVGGEADGFVGVVVFGVGAGVEVTITVLR